MTAATGLRTISRLLLAPDQAAGLYAWYKVDTLSALANNDPVTSWTDSSGNSRTIAQATGGRQPLYKTGVWNSRPGVLCDGLDDGLALATFGSVLAQPTTIIMVFKILDTGSGHQFHDGPGGNRQTLYINAGNWIMWDGSDGPSAPANLNAHVMTQIHNGASSSMRIDGIQVATGNPGTNGLGGLYLGNTQAFNGGIQAYFGDFALYSGTPAAAPLQAVERGLGVKYGIGVA